MKISNFVAAKRNVGLNRAICPSSEKLMGNSEGKTAALHCITPQKTAESAN
jgi:hypothetical protein